LWVQNRVFLSEFITVSGSLPSASQIEMQNLLFHNNMIISDLRMEWLLNGGMMGNLARGLRMLVYAFD
jgi:hypothetical protein